MTADDPYNLGPWHDCSTCHRRYRPDSPDGKCYDHTRYPPMAPPPRRQTRSKSKATR